MKHTVFTVAHEYAKRNIELFIIDNIDAPLPSNEQVKEAVTQLQHFAKQGVKVKLK